MESTMEGHAPQVRLIIAPVDGSESAGKSARIVFELAGMYKAKVVVLSVVAAPGFSFSGPAGAPMDLTEYYKLGTAEAGRAVESALKQAKEMGLDVRGEVIEPVSSTVGAIVEYAEKEKADLIVMGNAGLGRVQKAASWERLDRSRLPRGLLCPDSQMSLAQKTAGHPAASTGPKTNRPNRRTQSTIRVIATYIRSFSAANIRTEAATLATGVARSTIRPS